MAERRRLRVERLRWVVLSVAVLACCSAAPVLAQSSSEPSESVPASAETRDGDPRLQPPNGTNVAEGIVEAEQAEAERAEWLASPAAIQERERSKLAFTGLAPTDAEALIESVFAEYLEALDSDPARFLSGAQLVRPLGAEETAGVVRDEGDSTLMDAGIPVRTEEESGELAKVDLSLEAADQGWETANALTDIVIPESADAPVEIGEDGISVTQVGAEDGHAGRLLGGESVYFHEAMPDVGTIAAPVSGGAELFDVLFSEKSPEQFAFDLDLPQGSVLQPDRFGGAEVTREGETVGYVRFPTAVDAQGTPVPVDMQVQGDTLAIAIEHRDQDLAYPLLLDPEFVWENWYTANWWNGHGLAALTDGTWSPYASVPWIIVQSTPVYATFGGSNRGLFLHGNSGTWDANRFGQYSYTVPDWDSYIDHSSLLPFWRDDHGCGYQTYTQPHDYVGHWDGAQWIGPVKINEARTQGFSNLGQWGKMLIIGIGSGGGGHNPCARDIYVGGVGVWLDDWGPPTLAPVSGAPTGWVNDSKQLSINVSASDPGLGVQYVRLYSGASGKWDLWPGCIGTRSSRCPAVLNGPIPFNAKGFNEGVSTASVQAYDATQEPSNWQQFQIKVDRTSPQLTLSGQLAAATKEEGSGEQPPGQGDELSMAVYKLGIKAEDQYSGLKDIKVYLDGKSTPEPDTWAEQPCSQGACKMEVIWPLKLFELAPGPHTLKIVGIDHAGNETEPQRKVEFEYVPATGIKDDYVLHHIPLPDGQGDEDEEEVPDRPELAVNVMNGNLVYREKDVEVEGANADLEVERYYNSMLPEEANTEWGDGWTLAQTPELEATDTGGSPAPDRARVRTASAAPEQSVLPEQEGSETFDPILQAVVRKEPGGAFSIDPEISGEETVVFDPSGKVDEVEGYNEATLDYSYEGGDLSEIAIEEPPAPHLPPVEIEVPKPPTFASTFGTNGSADGQLKSPADVAIDAAGNIWVADKGNNRIQKFSPNGQFLAKFGSTGAGNGQFSSPAAIAIDPKGSIWVADKGNGRIQKFNASGEYLSQFGSKGTGNGQFGNGGPEGIAIDPKGNIWVADTYNGRLQKFDETGAFLKVVGSKGSGSGQLGEPTGIDVGPGGDVWVADWQNNRVAVFNPAGEFLRQFGSAGSGAGQFNRPDEINVDSKGNVWVGDQNNGRIQRLGQDGKYVDQFGSKGSGEGQFSFAFPMGMATDNKGNLWVADVNNNRVQKWVIPNYAPAYSAAFGSNGSGDGQLKAPADVAIDAAGDLWVADRNNNRIQKFSAKGEFLSKFGSAGSGNGQLSAPTSLAIDAKGEIWVADRGNNRIQRFDSEGEYVGKFGSFGSGSGQFNGPEGIAVDYEGNLWVSDTYNGRVQKLNRAGEVLKIVDAYPGGNLGEPTGIDVGPGGNVWVADWQANRVVVFDDEGEFVHWFGLAGTGEGQFNRPDAIDVEAGGNVWVGDQNNGRVQQFNQHGEFVAQFGSKGSGEGQFSFTYPMGLVADQEGSIWIADVNNSRVQKWTTGRTVVAAQAPVEGMETDDASVAVDVEAGLVSAVEGEEAGEHSYEHDGDLLTAHDGPDGESQYDYDAAGRLTEVVLPNGTNATIEYESTYGRVKSVTADPAGAEPAKTVTFAYDDDKREAKVTEAPNPTITYYLGADGSVFKWAPVGAPPAFDDIGGSSSEFLDIAGDLPDRDHELVISATGIEQVTSVKVLKDGNQLLAEETCSSTPEGRCELQWVTSARAHAPGRLDLEFIAVDASGRAAAERHFVNIPYLPPPDPAAPVKPDFEHIKQFRTTYGLDLDLAGNQREINKRIWQLLTLWELHEPIARASTDAWGVPMRSQDWAELNFRQSYIAQAAGVIPPFGQSHASTYAGYYIDHAAGGTLNVGFTEGAEGRVATLKPMLTAPAVRVHAFTAVRTLAQLKSIEGAIAADWQANSTLRSQITSLYVNQRTNKVFVGVQNLEPASAILTSKYGANALEFALTPPPESPPQSRFNNKGEVQAGDYIRRLSGGCTAGFGAWDKGPPVRGVAEKRYFLLTAGHCGDVGEKLYRALKKEVKFTSELFEIGKFKRDTYNEHVDYTTDSAAVRIDDPDLITRTIFLSRTQEALPVLKPIPTYPGMTLCQSGVSSGVVRCGPILSPQGEAVTMSHSRSDGPGIVLTAQVPSSAGVIHGDSGGPVYDQATGRPVGLTTGSQDGRKTTELGPYGLRACIPVRPGASDCPVLGVTPLLPLTNAAGILDILGLHLVRN